MSSGKRNITLIKLLWPPWSEMRLKMKGLLTHQIRPVGPAINHRTEAKDH